MHNAVKKDVSQFYTKMNVHQVILIINNVKAHRYVDGTVKPHLLPYLRKFANNPFFQRMSGTSLNHFEAH